MAYGFGSGVRAELGATDYSNYLRGALAGAEMQAQGGAAIGAGVQNALADIGVGVQKFMKNKQEKIALQEATDIIVPLLNNAAVRSQLNIPEDATDEDVSAVVKKQVKIFGAPAALEFVRQAQNSAAFQAGIGAVPDMVTETIEMQEAKVPKFVAGNIESFNGVSPLQSTPEQSVEQLMPEGRLSPFLSAPNQPVEGLMPKGEVAPQVSISEAEPKTVKAVPDNIAPYFSLNPQTGELVPTRKLQVDAEETTKRFQELEQEKARINSSLKTGKEETVTGMTGSYQPKTSFQDLTGDTVKTYNQRLDEIEMQQAPLKEKLIELENARQSAVNFVNKPEEQPSVEEQASEVIDRSIRFAEEVNLDPVDKNQWLQMKTVLKEVPRKATDSEKIAAFVKAYSKIAPIDANVYFKIKNTFNTTPVITDLGGGQQIVTVGNQSFVINSEDNGLSASAEKYRDEKGYRELLVLTSEMGEEPMKLKHPDLYRTLKQLHVTYGNKNLLNEMVTLSDAILSISTPSRPNAVTTQSDGNREKADLIINQQ